MDIDVKMKTMNAVHRTVMKVSGGRFGWKAASMPVLKLTTTGRKSGQPRTVMLTSPQHSDDAILVVASKGGNDHHPAWFLNLRDNPQVEVETKGHKRTMTARILSSEERSELWPSVVAAYKGYAGYQDGTDREIPLVMLEA